jgi:hypothetical protein
VYLRIGNVSKTPTAVTALPNQIDGASIIRREERSFATSCQAGRWEKWLSFVGWEIVNEKVFRSFDEKSQSKKTVKAIAIFLS